jgi:hypothetical protein
MTDVGRPSFPCYPDCPECKHNVSAVVGGRCTVFVPYPEGDPRGLAGYCMCQCPETPQIRAWLDREQET